MSPFREIDHTADLALRVDAPDMAMLFAEAARGMYALMGCVAGAGAPPVRREIALDADDAETLLVDWLGELLYLYDVHAECYERFEVLECGPRLLRMRVHGRSGGSARRAIKAVTYSGLRITETPEGCWTTVTFDV